MNNTVCKPRLLVLRNVKIYHIIYKTTHSDGCFYIGRHSTKNLNDGYFGSGLWIQKVDKSKLAREVLYTASSFAELVELEEKYILENFNNPLCMNMKLASVGWTPADAKRIVEQQIKDGKNALANGSNIKRNIVTDSARKKAIEATAEMFKNGTHPLGGDLARMRIKQQIASGSHPGSLVFAKVHICPHCQKQGKGAIMFRHHFENCKKR